MNRLIAVDMTIADPACIEENYEFSLPEVWIDDQDEKIWYKIGINSKPVKFNWFEKFLLWIKNIFRREI